jgi:ATP-binding cassette subfamily C protein
MPGPLRAAMDACRRQAGYVILFSAALNLLYLAPSIYMLQVYDRVLAAGGMLTLVYLTLVLVAALLTLAFLDATRMRLLAVLGRRLDRLVAPHVLKAALQQKGREAAGAAHPLREFDTLRGALTGPPALAAIDAPWTPLYILCCFLIHPWIGVLALAGGIALMGIAYINQRAMHGSLRANEQASGALYTLQSADSAQGETARALGMQDALVQRQMRARTAMSDALNDSSRSNATYSATTKFARLLLQSLALGLGAYLALQQQITPGGIIAASILTARAFAPLELIVGAWRQFEQGRQAYGILVDVLRTQDETRTFTALPAPKGALAVQGVVVRAPNTDRLLLQGVSFAAEPSEIVGVIGPSGAGKTTLMRIVSGAAQADAGVVRLDGAALADWPPEALGRHIGYLPQDVALFAGSVSQNIARFQSGDDVDAAVVAAAQAAGAHDMILALPRGYDTELAPGGKGLSAGQAQRVALARALFRNPALLVLDEPNAHLDMEGETALVAALQSAAARGAAVLVVAHRAGFMNIADKLMVVQGGRIDTFGPRDQVMSKLSGQGGPRPVAVPEPAGRRS